MKLYILDQGALECDKNWVVAMSTYATINNKTIKPTWTKMPVYSVLIDHPEGKYIFDLGCDRDINQIMKDMGRHQCISFPYIYTEDQHFEHQLALANTNVSEITSVILSHMHYDHVGNLPLFSNIDVYVNKAEYEDVFINDIPGLYFEKYLKKPHVNYIQIDDEFELVNGVTIIPFGSGHCSGTLGMLVRLKEGNFIFPSDVAYSKENYGYPIKPTGKVYDTLGYMKQIEKLHHLAEKYDAKIMYPHDIEEFKTYKKAPFYYE